jgi:two-component system sensor histidine kinase KdpD
MVDLSDTARPSPESLLKVAAREGKGRLKLFLGAAPGVGKTYEMLLEGHDKVREGLDVVVGVVEHHNRDETRALLKDLEILPRAEIAYRGQSLFEMDLDAILKRKPALVLIDELAHTNAEGSRHPKRWHDVAEVLANGIDVYSTMNVQHLESANDVVARITGVIVRETVPDSLLDLADDIEIVDITPDELQQRLREGKIYPPDVASRAMSGFFTHGNLTALRELALRRTAERVDDAMRAHREQHGIRETWEASERILACIDGGSSAQTVVRRAKRLADRLRAPWGVVHVARGEAANAPARAAVLDAFRLAEDLGAETRMLTGDDPASDVLAYARDRNVSHLVVGAAARPWAIELVHGSMIRRLVREAGDIALVVCPQDQTARTKETSPRVLPSFGSVEGYLASTIMVSVAATIATTLDRAISLPNASLIFVIPIILAAIRFGAATSIFAATISVLAYNFFLTEPYFTFQIADPRNVLAIVFFLLIALITSSVAAQARARLMLARRQERQASDLQEFSARLVTADSIEDVGQITADAVASQLRASVVVLSGEGGRLLPIGDAPEPVLLAPNEEAAAQWTFDRGTATGRGADTLPGGRWLFVPIPGETGRSGVIGLNLFENTPRLDPEARRLLELIAAQTGVALERATYASRAETSRLEAQGERLKGALLSSVSHDLRTPLATVSTALQTLRLFPKGHSAKERTELLALAEAETLRLTGFVEHLLDMVRIDAGAVVPKCEPVEPADLVQAAILRASSALEGREVTFDVSSALPRIMVDYQLALAALANVLENTGKHTPRGSGIDVRARKRGALLAIEVIDSGPGIAPELLPLMFDKFARGTETDGRAPGTGLGLAIAKGFLIAQGGTIAAANRSDGSGAIFTLQFPLATGGVG